MTDRARWIRGAILSHHVRDVASLGPEVALLKWWPTYLMIYDRMRG